jgi:hypothetical protein
VGSKGRGERRRQERAANKSSWCEHGTITELEQQLQATRVDDWRCAAKALHDTPTCAESPTVAVVLVTQLDDDGLPHVLVLPLCKEHHDAGIEYAATHSILDSSMSFSWSDRAEMLRAIHGGPQPLCRSASMTFAIVRP